MSKIVDFNGIGYVAATFPVDDTTIAYLKANHLNAQTGNVDINGKNLAVKMGADGKVGFGTASTQTAADALLGIIVAYEQDGFASVQIAGGIDEVPAAEAVPTGRKELVVDETGKVKVLASTSSAVGGRGTTVAKADTANKLVSILL